MHVGGGGYAFDSYIMLRGACRFYNFDFCHKDLTISWFFLIFLSAVIKASLASLDLSERMVLCNSATSFKLWTQSQQSIPISKKKWFAWSSGWSYTYFHILFKFTSKMNIFSCQKKWKKNEKKMVHLIIRLIIFFHIFF